jgi:outer membrane protein TolC
MRKSIGTILVMFSAISLFAQQQNLDYYLTRALKNSPLLKDYLNQTMISQTDSILAKLNFGPQFNIISNNSYAPVISGWGYDEIITNLRNVNALATVSQEIAGRRYRQNQYEAIRLQSQSAMNSGKISEQDLKKNVIGQYIITYGDWQQYNFNIEMLGLFKNEETILKKLAENGVYKQTEFLTFLVNLKQQELVSTRLKNQYQNDFALLNFICGIEDTSFIQLPDPNMSAETLPEFFNSIFYGQFIVDSLKLKNADKQIDFSYKPKINLLADGGYLSSLTYQPERNFGASVGISINIPLFNGTFRKLRHDKIAIEEQTRQYYRDFYINQYHQQINRFLQQLHANQKIKEQISVQIDYTQTLMNAYQKLLQTGDIRITDYMLAIGNYLTAKNLLVQNIIERYQIINELNYWNRTK